MRLGVDIGGTKIAFAVLDAGGRERLRHRVPAPRGAYPPALEALAEAIRRAESEAGEPCTVGIGMPGLVDPATGVVYNAYNTPFNEKPLKPDLEAALGREVRFANDARCFALSEAVDGAASDARVVFGAILGTGVGGGIVVGSRVLNGIHGIAGEWGHTPLPWMTRDEYPGPMCNCGRPGCIEQWCSGPALGREKDAPPQPRTGPDAPTIDTGSWVIVEIPGFKSAASGKSVDSLDALRKANTTAYYQGNGSLWVKLVSSGDILGSGPTSGPSGGASLQVSR